MKGRTLKICGICFIGIFLLINIIWGIYHISIFGKYEAITVDEAVPDAKISLKDNLTFSVSKTRYLDFGGNLGIVDAESQCYLIIWPTMFNGNTYGFMMSDKSQTYYFIIDEDGNLLNSDDFTAEEQLIYNENKESAQHLLNEFIAWRKAAINGDKTFFD